jgi:mannose-6-phosphate isomerase-like protein (cupin superfamily)
MRHSQAPEEPGMASFKKAIAEATGRSDPKPWKATLFATPRLLLGVNCFERGQGQPLHEHRDQDKFYVVSSGRGFFTIGPESFEAAAGDVVWAPATVPHAVENRDAERLVVLVGIAPAPAP